MQHTDSSESELNVFLMCVGKVLLLFLLVIYLTYVI